MSAIRGCRGTRSDQDEDDQNLAISLGEQQDKVTGHGTH